MPIFLQLIFCKIYILTVGLIFEKKAAYIKNLHNFCKLIVKNTCILLNKSYINTSCHITIVNIINIKGLSFLIKIWE